MSRARSASPSPLAWDLGNIPPGIPWAGVDEAGRGAWAGPVVAACAVLDRECCARWEHVLRHARDSKQLRPERRESLAGELKALLPAWSVAERDPLAIDRDNILEATKDAMRQAIAGCSLRPRLVLVDGDRAPGSGLLERTVVDGDALSCAIACASILAKAHRDAQMRVLDALHPGYGFARHKGYGTQGHQEALAALGPSAVHRMSYAPVARLARPDAAVFRELHAALMACGTAADLRAWVEACLRPAYGRLKPAWVEALRERYSDRLMRIAGAGRG